MVIGIMLETGVDSFIVRFVQEKSESDSPAATTWHGFIRHVQSKEEIRFTRIEDALHFVANYVEIMNDAPVDHAE
jgi:hypothetical protein